MAATLAVALISLTPAGPTHGVPAGEGSGKQYSFQAAALTAAPRGRVRVEVASNAQKVQVRYLKSGHRHTKSKRLVRGRAVWTLPAGSTDVDTRVVQSARYWSSSWASASETVDNTVIPQGVSSWFMRETPLAAAALMRSGDTVQWAEFYSDPDPALTSTECRSGRVTGHVMTYKTLDSDGRTVVREVSQLNLSDDYVNGWSRVTPEEMQTRLNMDPASVLARCDFANPRWR